MGFLVMDEMFDQWTVAKNPYDYHLFFREWSHVDTRDTVRRDRNHPSVIVYSAGNEIHDTPNTELAKGILRGLVEVFHTSDPTRPVTQALFRPNVSHDYDNGPGDLPRGGGPHSLNLWRRTSRSLAGRFWVRAARLSLSAARQRWTAFLWAASTTLANAPGPRSAVVSSGCWTHRANPDGWRTGRVGGCSARRCAHHASVSAREFR
jgi:hypothetical protein